MLFVSPFFLSDRLYIKHPSYDVLKIVIHNQPKIPPREQSVIQPYRCITPVVIKMAMNHPY